MKKISLAIISVAFLLAASSAHAFDINVISAWGKQTVEPLAYTVETSGNNLRIYTWCDPAMKQYIQYRVSAKSASFEISRVQCTPDKLK